MIPFLHPNKVRRNPKYFLLICLFSPVISFLISIMIFPSSPSFPFLFFIILQIILYVFSFFEEETSRLASFFKLSDFSSIREDIFRLIEFFVTYFVIIFISFLVLFLLLPGKVRNKVFEAPLSVISYLRGQFLNDDIIEILRNNFVVLIATLIISLVYLTGSTFVVTWNASVLACIIGEILLEKEHPIKILGYLLHGFPEIISYILAGIAGGIISMALSKRYEKVFLLEFFRIAFLMILLSVLLIFFAFGIEVSISPILIGSS